MLKAMGFKKKYLLFFNWLKKSPYSPGNMRYGQDIAENKNFKNKKTQQVGNGDLVNNLSLGQKCTDEL